MKILGCLNVVVLLLFLLVPDKLAYAQEPHFVCANEPVPDGWVITALYPSNHCTGTEELQLTRFIENIAGKAAMFACDGSPIPPGWVVTARYQAPWCISAPFTALTRVIETSAGKTVMYACDDSPVPQDWVTTIFRLVDWCTGHDGNNIWTRQIESTLVRSAFYACDGSTIPDGWVIVQRPTTDYCSRGFGVFETNFYERVAAEKVACLGTPIPTGWQIVANRSVPACGANPAAVLLRRIGASQPPSPPPPSFDRSVGIKIRPQMPDNYICRVGQLFIDGSFVADAGNGTAFLPRVRLSAGSHVMTAPQAGCTCISDCQRVPISASIILDYVNGQGQSRSFGFGLRQQMPFALE